MRVASSDSPQWKRGDEVVLTGWGLSETHPGGFTQRQRVRSEWLTPKPPGLTLQQTMAVGTAGLDGHALRPGVLEGAGQQAGDGDGFVTGAAGGVGSIAIGRPGPSWAASPTASTGRVEAAGYLRKLGATGLIDRNELAAPGRPLDKERWAGGIDTVGSQTLATLLAQTRYRGAVVACGLAGGNDLPATVLPFILRAVSLLRIELGDVSRGRLESRLSAAAG